MVWECWKLEIQLRDKTTLRYRAQGKVREQSSGSSVQGLDFIPLLLIGEKSILECLLVCSLSIKVLVGGLREKMEVKAERGQDSCREKFQKKFKLDMLVFVCLFDAFLGGQHYSRVSFFPPPHLLHQYKYSRKCTYYEMIMLQTLLVIYFTSKNQEVA